MPFQLPAESQLTQSQSAVLGKLKTFSNYAIAIPKTDLFIPKSRQISLFDYIKKIFNAIGGRTMFESLLKRFLKMLFDPASKFLETKILDGIAHSLDAQNIHIKQGTNNKDWLYQNILPGMDLAKDQLFALILSMIFGPPSAMLKAMKKSDKSGNTSKYSETSMLKMSSCGQMLYSMSNLPEEGVGDLEYRKIKLEKQLSEGGIVFDISCQEVVIKMPDRVLESITTTDEIIPETGKKGFNPETAINKLDVWVQSEVSRQNVPENKTDASKSFWEGFVQKVLNLITTAVTPQLDPIFLLINQQGNPVKIIVDKITGASSVTPVVVKIDEVSVDPCTIYSDGLAKMSGKPENNNKSAFMTFLLNAVLGLLLSVLLSELIKLVKKLLKNVLIKKATDLAKRLINKRKSQIETITGGAAAAAKKAAKLAKSLEKLKPILEMIKGI